MSNYPQDSETEEDEEDYCKGGYHPVQIGDVYHDRYRVLRKLGNRYLNQVGDTFLQCG